MTTARARFFDSALLLVLGVSVVLALLAVSGWGIDVAIGGVRLSVRSVWRPSLIAVIAAAFLLGRSALRQQALEQIWRRVLGHARASAIGLGVLTIVIAWRVSSFEAEAADAYGYISQAHLWADGRLVQDEPLSLRVPWPASEWTFSPLGYRPGVERGTIVPSYPPGLPLTMAAPLVAFGESGPFAVVPLLGGLTIGLALLLGRRIGGDACGLVTALLVLTSPVFLFQLTKPMSDVPVTAWWLIALLLASRTTPVLIFLGGLAAALAILTRPNLVPLAAVLGVFVLLFSADSWRRRFANAGLFAAGVAPGCVAVALVNAHLYGSPLLSGYGDTSVLFGLDHFRINLAQYSRWLFDMETTVILLAPVGWWLLRRREDSSASERFGTSGRWSSLILAFSVVLYGCYAFYTPFDNWTYLRFLLPAISLLWLLCAVALAQLGSRLHAFLPKFLLAGFVVLFVAWRWDGMGLKPLPPNERRFAVVGEYVRNALPPNAVVFALLHSGSIRYYSGRTTLRWDYLPEDWLDRSVEFLTSIGYRPYLLVEQGSERAQFIERFSGHSKLGALTVAPLATYRGETPSDLYDLANPVSAASAATIEAR